MIMDIDLLSRMVGELIVDHDQVGLPGVGTFVAEMVPASFSDKGFTINPPYRRLSFRPKCLEDKLLIDFYASTNPIPRETAATYITQFLAEMRAVLEERKSITLPELGRLRATRENAIFFVPEEGLDIFPGGIGLRPVSLKSHVMQPDDPVVINVPIPVPQPEVVREEIPGQAGNDKGQAGNDECQAGNDKGQSGNDECQAGNDDTSIIAASSASDKPEPQGDVVPARDSERSDRGGSGEPSPDLKLGSTSGASCRWWIPVAAVLGTAAVVLAVFMILARVAPDFIDSILYTPEELRIIKY